MCVVVQINLAVKNTLQNIKYKQKTGQNQQYMTMAKMTNVENDDHDHRYVVLVHYKCKHRTLSRNIKAWNKTVYEDVENDNHDHRHAVLVHHHHPGDILAHLNPLEYLSKFGSETLHQYLKKLLTIETPFRKLWYKCQFQLGLVDKRRIWSSIISSLISSHLI